MTDFQPKFLHCRIRVRDLNKSIKFYSDLFGFQTVSQATSPAGNSLAYLKLPGSDTLLELCYQPDAPDFNFPEDIFHFAFNVPDLNDFRAQWEPKGVEFWPTEGPVNGRFYFVNDPDGYEIEVLKADL